MGSADWMPRNLDRRVELVFPIDDQDLKERTFGILELMLSDTVNARIQQPDTTYAHIDKRGKAVINSQTEFARLAREALEAKQVVDEKKPMCRRRLPPLTRGSWKIRRKAGEIRLNRRPVSAFVLISRREWEAPWPVKMGHVLLRFSRDSGVRFQLSVLPILR